MTQIDLFEFGQEKDCHLHGQQLAHFKDYLAQLWESRQQWYEGRESNNSGKKQRLLDFDGSLISARNYVGFIQYGQLQINIWPKIFRQSTASQAQIMQYLLYWLSYSERVKFPLSEVSFEGRHFDTLPEAMIYLFAHYTEKILSEKPWQTYEELTEESAFMRGRLATAQYIRNNLSTGNWQHLSCTYEPFVYDHLFNRIVKYVASRLSQLSTQESTQQKLASIALILAEVSEQPCVARDCDRVKINPLFEELQVVLSMCRLFLVNEGIQAASGAERAFCFLLPMESVFEDFAAGFFKKHFSGRFAVYSQLQDVYLAKTSPQQARADAFRLRHDIVLASPQGRELIIDTKYKLREAKTPDTEAGISYQDMYQVYSYAVARRCKNAVLLYPALPGTGGGHRHSFVIDQGQPVHIHAFELDIAASSDPFIRQQLEKLTGLIHND